MNAIGTLRVLQAERAAGVRQLVYTSTAQVYGFARRVPSSEDDLPQPTSPYAACKLAGEGMCLAFKHSHRLGSNVGTGVMTTLLKLAELRIELSGKDVRPVVEGEDIPRMRLQADRQTAAEVLRFEA